MRKGEPWSTDYLGIARGGYRRHEVGRAGIALVESDLVVLDVERGIDEDAGTIDDHFAADIVGDA